MRRNAALTLHTHTARRSERETIYSEAFRNRCDAARCISLPGNMGTGGNDGRPHRFGSRCHVLSTARRSGRDGFKPVADRFRYDRRIGTLRIPDPRAGYVHRVRHEGSIPTQQRVGTDRLRRYGADAHVPHAKDAQHHRARYLNRQRRAREERHHGRRLLR